MNTVLDQVLIRAMGYSLRIASTTPPRLESLNLKRLLKQLDAHFNFLDGERSDGKLYHVSVHDYAAG